MKKRSRSNKVIMILGVILGVIVADLSLTQCLTRKRDAGEGDNLYVLDLDAYRQVDSSLISHREIRQLSLGTFAASAMDLYGDSLYIAGDSSLVILSAGTGSLLTRMPILPSPTSLLVTGDNIYVAYSNFVAVYGPGGEFLSRWDKLGDRAIVTNLAMDGEHLYVADAGNRKVWIYTISGELLGAIEGKEDENDRHGFIIPSANFDLGVNSFGELWVANPGKHHLVQFGANGDMKGYWNHPPATIEGFQGCCNPARFTFMENGNFITSEKKIVRVKIHKPSGELVSVVAAPDDFPGDEEPAPDVEAGADGRVYLLDYSLNAVRIYEPKSNE